MTGDGWHGHPEAFHLKEAEHWDRFFAKHDPWNYTSEYEQQKYRHTLELLPSRRIDRAVELGCAEGVFTELLAPRVESLVAADISAVALERARARCAAHGHVTFAQHDLSAGMPGCDYDLVVCSEILYYLRDRAAIERFVGKSVARYGRAATLSRLMPRWCPTTAQRRGSTSTRSAPPRSAKSFRDSPGSISSASCAPIYTAPSCSGVPKRPAGVAPV